jgi:hypothetical protein
MFHRQMPYTVVSNSMTNHHRKLQFLTRFSQILMQIGELVDSTENSIVKFQRPLSCTFYAARVQKS